MKKTCLTYTFITSLLLTLSCFSLASSKAGMALVKEEHRVLMTAQTYINNDELDKAISTLQQFNKGKISKLAKSLSQQLLGSVYQTQTDYSKALQAYEAALTYQKLPLATKVSLFEKIHKLNYYLKDWKKTVNWWLKWEKRAKPNAKDYLLLSSAYQHQEQWQKAKQALVKAIALKDNPPQAWLKLLLSYEEKLANPKEQITLLEKMLEKFPENPQYWLKLAAVYSANDQSEKANSLLYSAFSQGIAIGEANIYKLAGHFSHNKNPMLVVRLLTAALKSEQLQATTLVNELIIKLLIEAKDYQQALNKLKQAAKNTDLTPAQKRLNIRQSAKMYFYLKDWQNAYNTAMKLEEATLQTDQEMQLLLGLSSAYLANPGAATQHFQQVLTIDPANETALYWQKKLASAPS